MALSSLSLVINVPKRLIRQILVESVSARSYLITDSGFQQETSESPGIVQALREHDEERPGSVITR